MSKMDPDKERELGISAVSALHKIGIGGIELLLNEGDCAKKLAEELHAGIKRLKEFNKKQKEERAELPPVKGHSEETVEAESSVKLASSEDTKFAAPVCQAPTARRPLPPPLL